MTNVSANRSPTSQVKFIKVIEDQAGQRIDNFLLTQLKGVPKSHVYRILRKGEVRVNKSRAKPGYRLQAGDTVRIPPIRREEKDDSALPPNDLILSKIQNSLLYEDKGLLILNKPTGIAVHGGSGIKHGVIEALRALHPEAPFLELVHRLDRDTSGCLIIAKKRSVLRALHELLRSHQVEKRYLSLVKGDWRGGTRRVELALQKNTLSSGERIVRVDEGGKASQSLFNLVNRYHGTSLLEMTPLTGRTHQLRVHAASIGYPIAGDEKYGDAEFNKQMRELGLKRLFLHAHSLAFELPPEGKSIQISAPLDNELQKVLDQLGKK